MRVVDLAEVRAARALASAEALDLARKALGRRALSRAELGKRLDEQGVEVEDRDAALDRLADDGALDDQALAESIAEKVHRRKGGARAVEMELAKRGIAKEDRSVESSDDEELERATTLARDKLRRGPIDDVAERRVAGMLARRGYGFAIARRAIDAAKAAE